MDKITFLRSSLNDLAWRTRGSVTIEFAIIFPVLVMLALILLDFTTLYANESRLARSGYSLASVFR
ncbi:TPA: pilus assembly protein, partial [Salmonella enterica subsp. enterica]|nr:pilus assembly protein [Salmonella enterica subsp. enterica]